MSFPESRPEHKAPIAYNVPMARKTFAEYMALYQEEHTQPGTKLTHVVGIPLIVLSLAVMVVRWQVGLLMFVFGWILQAIGHRIEGNKPAFFSDPLYLVVGLVWSFREIGAWLGPRR